MGAQLASCFHLAPYSGGIFLTIPDYSRSVADVTATCRVAPDLGCVLGVRKEAAGPARGPATPTEPFT